MLKKSLFVIVCIFMCVQSVFAEDKVVEKIGGVIFEIPEGFEYSESDESGNSTYLTKDSTDELFTGIMFMQTPIDDEVDEETGKYIKENLEDLIKENFSNGEYSNVDIKEINGYDIVFFDYKVDEGFGKAALIMDYGEQMMVLPYVYVK